MVAASALLALAIGLASSTFALVDALLIRPLPFDGADRMTQVFMGSDGGGRLAVAPDVLRAWRSSSAFDLVEGVAPGQVLIETPAGLSQIVSATVSPTLFASLNVRPLAGRLLDAGDIGNDRVALSEDLWRRLFDREPAVVGRAIRVDGQLRTVVGILPADFRFPAWNTTVWAVSDFRNASGLEMPQAYVRYAHGVPSIDALASATALAHQANPADAALRAIASPVVRAVPFYEQALPLLSASVAMVFFVLCANVASLLLVRLTGRRQELAIATALGASRARLIRQALLESGAIGAAGVIGGVALAALIMALTRNWLPEALLIRTLNPINLDARALVVAAACGVAATMAAGVLPAWLGTRARAADALVDASRGGTAPRATRSATRVLLVVEVAMAFTLLITATLLGRSFINLVTADRGLDTQGVTTAWLSMPPGTFADRASRAVTAAAIEEALRSLPDVRQIAVSSGLPPGGGGIHFPDDLRSDVEAAPVVKATLQSYGVGREFFDLYRIPLVQGRTFQPGDSPSDVIIGARLAYIFWPGQTAIGRSFQMNKTWYRVIGVARETHLPSLDPREDRPEFYFPFTPGSTQLSLNIRCQADCPSAARLTQQILSVHPALQVHRVQRLDEPYAEHTGRPRAVAAVSLTLAGIALLAAAAGFFGVLSYAVGLRRREFGIRAALGASRATLWALVVGDGLRVVGVGIAFGSIAAWWLAQTMATLHYGVSVTDPWTWGGVSVLTLMTAALAAWRPAREASRANPTMLLRSE